ncbi:MAG TPA: rod shape-determining protein RodA [Clostridia bacterium]|nr:rod shape-determining protein RodA [Clostridia bacterium]
MISVNKSTSTNFFKQFDYLLFIAVLALSVFGLVVLYSATRQMVKGNGDRIFTMQVICMIIGIIAAIVICKIDYTVYKVLGPFMYIGSIILLIIVFTFPPINGSKSWINVKGLFTFQPAELAKIAFVMIIAYFLERIEEERFARWQNTIKTLLYAMIPILLVILQPDLGTCMVFMFIGFVMFFVAGLKYKYIMWGIVATFISFPLVWYLFIEKNDYIKDRILSFLDPTSNPLSAGYNVLNSKLAIGSGGLFGQGWLNGNMTQTMSVPVKESDFIFSVIGEEFGIIGCVLVVALILFILLRCLYIAKNSRDKFGSYMVIGITALFAFHAFENIGMTIGLLPCTGIPLPFVSAGGTALVSYFAAIGIVMSISIRRKRKLFNA